MAEYKPLPDVESTPPQGDSGIESVEPDAPQGPDAHPDTPYKPSDRFKTFLRAAEGSRIDPKTGLHIPHLVEGKWHIGIGHLIGDGLSGPGRFEGGISDTESDRIFADDIMIHRNRARDGVGAKKFDALDQHRQEMLTEIAYNTGSLESHPNFTQAVLDNKMHLAAMHHHRKNNAPRDELMAGFMGVEYYDTKFAQKVIKLQEKAKTSDGQLQE
jgi:hypothetical protein